jgi:2'-5' RNA ligase
MGDDKVTSALRTGYGALVILLPRKVTQQIAGWRARFDPYHLTIPAHITVMYPPFISLPDWPDARVALAYVVAGLPAFDVALARAGAFQAPQHVLWLDPQDDGTIRRLEERVRNHLGLAPSPPPFEFTPHVTLGFFEDEAALHQAEAEVSATLTPVTFRAERVAYFVCQDDRTWRPVEELSLGREERSRVEGVS